MIMIRRQRRASAHGAGGRFTHRRQAVSAAPRRARAYREEKDAASLVIHAEEVVGGAMRSSPAPEHARGNVTRGQNPRDDDAARACPTARATTARTTPTALRVTTTGDYDGRRRASPATKKDSGRRPRSSGAALGRLLLALIIVGQTARWRRAESSSGSATTSLRQSGCEPMPRGGGADDGNGSVSTRLAAYLTVAKKTAANELSRRSSSNCADPARRHAPRRPRRPPPAAPDGQIMTR